MTRDSWEVLIWYPFRGKGGRMIPSRQGLEASSSWDLVSLVDLGSLPPIPFLHRLTVAPPSHEVWIKVWRRDVWFPFNLTFCLMHSPKGSLVIGHDLPQILVLGHEANALWPGCPCPLHHLAKGHLDAKWWIPVAIITFLVPIPIIDCWNQGNGRTS